MAILQPFWKHLSSPRWLVSFIACPRDKCKQGWLCCCMFYLRQILPNVESCLLKWQWSIMTDVVIIGHCSVVWHCILSRLKKKKQKAAPSKACSSPAAFLSLINLHFEDRYVLLMHFYHCSLLYCILLRKKTPKTIASCWTWSQSCMFLVWKSKEKWIIHAYCSVLIFQPWCVPFSVGLLFLHSIDFSVR